MLLSRSCLYCAFDEFIYCYKPWIQTHYTRLTTESAKKKFRICRSVPTVRTKDIFKGISESEIFEGEKPRELHAKIKELQIKWFSPFENIQNLSNNTERVIDHKTTTS